MAARHRAPNGISRAERDQLLLHHFDVEYELAAISTRVISQAVALTQRYRLRGYDAIQLATALDVRATALRAGLPDLTFITADDDLVTAALAEGLTAANPNRLPA